jgi:hypothetical protein
MSILQNKAQFTEFRESERTKVYLGNGITAYLVTATIPFPRGNMTYLLKDTFAWFIHGDTGYVITYDTTESHFDSYDSLFRSMLSTFKFLGE